MSDSSLLWYQYPVCVPFGNSLFDAKLGGAHDIDVRTPPNTPITALLPGKVVSITAPTWGKSVGVELDDPFNNIGFMAYLHLAATSNNLSIGTHISIGDMIGWSGGANSMQQYQGTNNPTGQNFLNTPDMSSQPQTGIALMRGPVYGVGQGWSNFPPVDWTLDPSALIFRARAALTTWNTFKAFPFETGIARSWREKYIRGELMPPPQSTEVASTSWSGAPVIVQEFGSLRCEWDGQAHWYRY